MCGQPAVLENLVFSMKFVLSGMGLLRINLEHPHNKVTPYTCYCIQSICTQSDLP